MNNIAEKVFEVVKTLPEQQAKEVLYLAESLMPATQKRFEYEKIGLAAVNGLILVAVNKPINSDISDCFLKSLATTERLIFDAIIRLANGDEKEVFRIISNEAGLKDTVDKERYFVELFLSLALSECKLCMINFEDGNFLNAFTNLALANRFSEASSILRPSESFKKIRNKSVELKKVTLANQKRVVRWNISETKLKLYWQANMDPKKRATDAAILLEKTSVYADLDLKPKRSTLEGYIRKWQALQN